MVHRIVMDVIDAGPKVPMRLDHAVETVEPDFSTTLILFAISVEGCAPVQPPHLVSQCFDVIGSYEHVVMVRQDAPGVNAGGKLLAHAQ